MAGFRIQPPRGRLVYMVRVVAVVACVTIAAALFFVKPSYRTKTFSSLGIRHRNRDLVTYAYSESDNARDNIEFFIRHGIHPDADFVFILNGPTDVDRHIPRAENIEVVYRDNSCFDLGAHGQVLLADDRWRRYRRFITLNASIRGPFLPYWCSEKWTDLYLNKVTDKVKLVGMTINCDGLPHIQSMIWATDSVGMAMLLDTSLAVDPATSRLRGLGVCYTGREAAVRGEVATSHMIRSQGYEIDVMMTAYHAIPGLTFENCTVDIGRDVNYNGAYYGINVHPYETIFIKANRNIDKTMIAKFTEWHDAMASGTSSW